MIPQEESSLDLIRRRQVHPYATGHAVILLLLALLALLPVVKVEVKIRCPGMVRPSRKPAIIAAPVTGTLVENRLRDGLHVEQGDTLARISSGTHSSRLQMFSRLTGDLDMECRDIERILSGGVPGESPKIVHSFNAHMASVSSLTTQRDLAHEKFLNAGSLFRLEVMPRMEYEKVRAEYLVIESRLSQAEEEYLLVMGKELLQLHQNRYRFSEELESIRHSIREQVIVAPLEGTLQECKGFYLGSAVMGGTGMGIISPGGSMVAECYLSPEQVAGVGNQTRVMLRFHLSEAYRVPVKEARVDHIDRDVTFMNGEPRYIVRCSISDPMIRQGNGSCKQIRKGMTFTAEMVMDRRSVAGVILERIIRRVRSPKPTA